jgi:hypothetical protein
MKNNLLEADDLSMINAYQPNLNTCWMFQRAMSVAVSKETQEQIEKNEKFENNGNKTNKNNDNIENNIKNKVKPELIIGTLQNSFSAMEKLGSPTMRPFLQDVLQFEPLLKTLLLAAVNDPLTPFKVIPQVGFVAIFDFLYHFSLLGLYTFLSSQFIVEFCLFVANLSFVTPKMKFFIERQIEAWKFGSGLDYYDHE